MKKEYLVEWTKKYWRIGFITVAVLIPVFYGLLWLSFAILFLAIIYRTGSHLVQQIKYSVLQKWINRVLIVLSIFALSIGIKLFVFDIYRIPSGSMEDTLFPGDVILVNKLIYGPKLPRSPFEISWVNLLFYLNSRARAKMEQDWWPYKRFEGSKEIEQGDILVYQFSKTIFVVKRCVAVAGDSLAIVNGEIFTDNKKFRPPETIKNNYLIKIKNKRRFYRQLDSLDLNTGIFRNGTTSFWLNGNLSYKQRETVEGLAGVQLVKKELDTFSQNKGLFAMPWDTQWTLDNLGPLVVPKKGMTVCLNPFTFGVYKKVLHEHEKVVCEETDGVYYVNGKNIDQYTFKQDYYFVMGDNRKGSMDSRYIGFIPKENIIAKVQCVLFSNYGGGFDWQRLFKRIDL
ncbi:signal peptidase I [Arenibacter algicola]|nr:signal peptidase I [Arenibacter algicola]